jgi:hypothetical protein
MFRETLFKHQKIKRDIADIMKTKFLLPMAVLALALAATGCNKAGKLNEASQKPLPTGPMELKLKWPLGEHVVQNMDTKTKTETVIPGQPQPMQQNITMGQKYSMTVLKEDPDGSHQVQVEFLSARMGMDMNGKTMMDYDSEKSSSASTNPAAAVFGKIVGSKITLFMDPSNQVDHVEGVDEMVSRLSSGPGNSAAASSLKGMMSEDYFKQMMSSSRFLPPKAVAPGDTWSIELEQAMEPIGTLMLSYDITLTDWEKHGKRNCARLDFTGTVKTKPGTASPGGLMGMTLNIKDGTTSGTSWFDPELGIIIDSTLNQEMTLAITLPKNPKAKTAAAAAAQPQTLNTHMTQDVRIKLDSLE